MIAQNTKPPSVVRDDDGLAGALEQAMSFSHSPKAIVLRQGMSHRLSTQVHDLCSEHHPRPTLPSTMSRRKMTITQTRVMTTTLMAVKCVAIPDLSFEMMQSTMRT